MLLNDTELICVGSNDDIVLMCASKEEFPPLQMVLLLVMCGILT